MDVNSVIVMLSDVMVWSLVGIIISIMSVIVVWYLSHKIHVRIRDISDGNKYVIYDKARIKEDKRGNRWFRLMKGRKNLPVPPSAAFVIGKRGKKYIDFYLTEDGVYLPIVDTFNFTEYKRMSEQKIQEHLNAIEGNKRQIPSLKGVYEPFTTNQRSLFITEIMESEKYLQKDMWGHLKDMMPYAAFIIMVALVLIFWGQITAPFLEAMGKAGQLLEQSEKLLVAAQQQGQTIPAEIPN